MASRETWTVLAVAEKELTHVWEEQAPTHSSHTEAFLFPAT